MAIISQRIFFPGPGAWKLQMISLVQRQPMIEVITMPKELHLFWYSIPTFYSFSFSFIYLIIYQT